MDNAGTATTADLQCRRCRYWKQTDEFSLGFRGRPRRICKKCVSDLSMVWAKANIEKRAWIQYRFNAKRRKLPFELSREQFEDLISDNCMYCHAEPNPLNGLDRVNSLKGYTAENTVTSCFNCNRAKADLSADEYLSWLWRLVSVQQSTASIVMGNGSWQ